MATGWKKAVGKAVTENKMLMGHSMALYQAQRHMNEEQFASWLGTTAEELPKIAETVVPQHPPTWAVRHKLNHESVMTMLAYAKNFVPRSERGERRMIAVRLQEREHTTIREMSQRLRINVTAVIEKAIQELAEKTLVNV